MIDCRKLTPPEEAMTILNQYSGCFSIATVSKIKGQLNLEILSKTLELIQAHHPLLNCRIIRSLHSLQFTNEGTNVISLDIIDNPDGKPWETIVIDKFNIPLEQDKCLLKCFLIQDYNDPNSSSFITVIHHGIADGRSTIRLHDLIFNYYEKLDNNLPIPQPEPFSFLPDIKTLLPWFSRSYAGFMLGIVSLLKQKVKEKIYQVKKISPSQLVSINHRKGHFIHHCLDENLTQLIIKKCQEETTTVHGAICASLLLTIAIEIQPNLQKNINLSCQSYIDLRQRLTPIISDEKLALMISFLISSHKITPKIKFWDLARDITKQLKLELKRGDFLKYPMLFKSMIKSSLVNPEEATPTVAVTNLGKIQMNNHYGNLEIENICFVPNVALYSNTLALAASTFYDKMTLNFAFSHPSISPETIEKLAKRMIDRLSLTVQEN